MKNLLKPGWLIAVLVFVVLLTLKHNYQVYTEIVSTNLFENELQNMWYSIMMMLSFDLGIFMLAVRGNRRASMIFSAILFALNTYFYSVQIGDWSQDYHHIIPGILFSGMSAYLVFFFSDEFAHEIRKRKENTQVLKEIEQLRAQLSSEQLQNACLQEEMKLLQFQSWTLEEKMEQAKKRNPAVRQKAKTERDILKKFKGQPRKKLRDAKLYREKKLQGEISEGDRGRVEEELKIINQLMETK